MTVARQKWRAWIETPRPGQRRPRAGPSPVRNGGRGLKRISALQPVRWMGPSPVRNGGRGLKLRARVGLVTDAIRRPSEMAGVD